MHKHNPENCNCNQREHRHKNHHNQQCHDTDCQDDCGCHSDMKTEMATTQSMKSDPNGSYTGRPRSKDEIPVQDADDL